MAMMLTCRVNLKKSKNKFNKNNNKEVKNLMILLSIYQMKIINKFNNKTFNSHYREYLNNNNNNNQTSI